MVPLQNRRMNAVVLELLNESPHRGRLKEIASIVAKRPMFTPGLLKLARWIAKVFPTFHFAANIPSALSNMPTPLCRWR